MAKIFGFEKAKPKKTKERPANDRHQEYREKARERDTGWQIFARAVSHVKNNGLSAKQADTILKLLVRTFKIAPEKIKIDGLIRAEYDGYLPDPGFLADSGDDIVFSLTWALQQNLIDRPQAVRIAKVIVVWYRLDIEK